MSAHSGLHVTRTCYSESFLCVAWQKKKKKQHVTWNSSADLSSCFMKQEQNNFSFQCWIVCTAQTCELSPIQHVSMPPSACASTVPASALFLWHAPHAYMRRGLSSLHVPTNVPQCVSTLVPSATMPFLLSDYETHTLGSSWLNISVPSELTIRSAGKRSVLSTTWLDTWFSLLHKKEKQVDFIIFSLQKWIYSRTTLKTLATANTFDVLLSSRAHNFFHANRTHLNFLTTLFMFLRALTALLRLQSKFH